jgi:HD-GYP domain-containing protein (c-di-GMP phosphodiesterase class II)
MSTRARDRRNNLLIVGLATTGTAALVASALIQVPPRPLWLWAFLATAYVVLEYSAVEVSDRLMVSSAVMVAFTAAVALGRESGVLAAAVMAALAILHPSYLRRRQWRLPVANFGQLVVSTTIGIALFCFLLPEGTVGRADIPRIVGAAIPAVVLYDWVNFRLVAFMTRRLYPEREMQPWSRLFPSHVAMAVLGVLGSLAGVAYLLVGPVILPLLALTFVVGHVGFASYSRLRDAYAATIGGLVKAIEALDPYTRGHTDRVAYFAGITGKELGLSPERLERLRWAALLHDVGKVAVPPALLRKPGILDAEEERRQVEHMRVVEELLTDVDFLAPMVQIVEEHHRVGAGGTGGVEARVLAAADAFDAMTSTRSYRAAVTQTQAFGELRHRSAALSTPVVDALEAAVNRRGEVYGSPDEASSAEVERLVKERSVRA